MNHAGQVVPTIKDIISRMKLCNTLNKLWIRWLGATRCVTSANILALDTFGSDPTIPSSYC